MDDRLLSAVPQEDDLSYDYSLRPRTFNEFIGQKNVKENLIIFIEAAKKRDEALDHVLLSGPPGLGKTSLAHIIANELNVGIKATSGPVIERAGDLAAILSNLKEKDILFIDEIHRLNHVVEEILYPAMEDYQLDIIIGKGPSARSIKLNLLPFTLIGATTRSGLITSPLRDRFGVVHRLDYYGEEDLFRIIMRSAKIISIPITEEGAWEIAKRSRGTPRVANRLLRRIRDYAQIKADGVITQIVAGEALIMLEVDERGFDSMDRRLLVTIIEKFSGGPVGLETLSIAVGEEKDTLEEVYEPFLVQSGYLNRTPRGRMATRLAYEHLKIKYADEEKSIQDEFNFK